MIYSRLTDEGWNGGCGKTWAEVAEMTDRQIFRVHLRPRRDDGTPVPETPDEPEHKREPTLDEIKAKYDQYAAIAIATGTPKEEIERAWQQYLEKREREQRGD